MLCRLLVVFSCSPPFSSFVVQPPKGVKQGEQFVGTVVRQPLGGSGEGDGHRIPTGQWRDGCCDCFKHGLCHPMFWLAACCQPLALGQVMTRMKLSATGSVVAARNSYWSAFKVLAIAFILYMGLNQVLATLIHPYSADMKDTLDDKGHIKEPNYSNIPSWVWAVEGVREGVQFVFSMYMLVLLIRTRAHVRHTYDIPETRCHGCEDCCCAVFAPCCTTLQLARHTADYGTYRAACCTETGLPPNAPEVV